MNKLFTDFSDTMAKNSPAILTGLGVTGFIYTAYLAAEASAKDVRSLAPTPEDPVERIKEVLPLYLPAIGMGLVSTACIFGSHSIATRRTHALASLYAFTDRTLKEYRSVVEKNVSKRKIEEIDEELTQRKLDQHPLSGQTVIFGATDGITVLDEYSGRYFTVKSIEFIHAAVNVVNRNVNMDSWCSLNDFYHELGMEPIGDGDNLGWDAGRQPLEVAFDATITKETKPVLVMAYDVTYQWTDLHS